MKLEDCKKGITFKLYCKHLIWGGAVLYAFIALMVYGSQAASWDRYCDARYNAEDCHHDFAPVMGPIVSAVLWPIYLPFHAAHMMFVDAPARPVASIALNGTGTTSNVISTVPYSSGTGTVCSPNNGCCYSTVNGNLVSGHC